MARFIRLKNQIVDLDAIHMLYVPAEGKACKSRRMSLHLVIGGVAVDLDQDDDAEALWEVIVDRLQVSDRPDRHPYPSGGVSVSGAKRMPTITRSVLSRKSQSTLHQ